MSLEQNNFKGVGDLIGIKYPCGSKAFIKGSVFGFIISSFIQTCFEVKERNAFSFLRVVRFEASLFRIKRRKT